MESDFFAKYPKAALQFGSWPQMPTPKKKKLSIDPKDAEVFYFWGLGSGEVIETLTPWLSQDSKRKLIILEEDLGAIRAMVEKKPELLNHEQVHLEWEFETPEHLEELIQKFPAKKLDFAAHPAKPDGEPLRLEIFRKASLQFALHIDRLYGYQPFRNFWKNAPHLAHSFYANRLRGAFENVPAVVCGAGPSLDQSMAQLEEVMDRALVIGGGSTLAALSHKGIMPHFGMALDPNLEEYRRFRNSFCFDVPLLYSTRVHPGVFNTTNGPFGYMRSGVGGLLELWLEEELGLEDALLGDFLPDETVSVTNMCIAWAIELGCNPIYLCGVDLAYTGDKHYATGVVPLDLPQFAEMDAKLSAPDRILKRLNGKGEEIVTAVRWIMEKDAIAKTAKQNPAREFFNLGLEGLPIENVPHQPIDALLKLPPIPGLRSLVDDALLMAKMPQSAGEVISSNLEALKESMDRLIGHLAVMCGKEEGIKAISELELAEEIATLYLFYDIRHILKNPETFWEKWYEIALEYQKVMHHS